jgi:putative DNA primase/helicase
MSSSRRRPQIVLRVGETERVVDEIESGLIDADRGLYRRGGLIVSTGFDRMQTWDGKTVEIQIIEEIGDYALLEQIEAVMDFIRFDKENKRVPLPMTLVRTLKERRHRLRLPNLNGVTNCPTIKANGELVTKPGYDPSTGMLFDPLGLRFKPVPKSPSKAEAQASLARISRLLATFPFVDVDDKAVALSLVLTAIARPGLPSAPMHAFEAPVAGAGKSKLVDLASILATGHEAGVVAQGENREEFEKRLSMLLMRGDPIIAIDNCELPVEGELLNSTLTQARVTIRILGHSKGITVRSAALIIATGNHLVIKGDHTRRTLNGRLDPKCERPEL